jgi:hypothetical protein
MIAMVSLVSLISVALGVSAAGATNIVGPGDGVDAGGHNNGAYSVTTATGQVLAYCITPGAASPTAIPNDIYSPLTAAANGGLAYLGYFAATFQGGFAGYSSDDVNAAVAYIAYGTGLGTAPAALVAIIEADMAAYPGPWSIALTPPSGNTYASSTNYTGDVKVTASNGTGVPGLAINPPATGGANEWSNFVWESNVATDVTDAAGNLPYQFNQNTAGNFAESFSIVGGAPGSAPVEYAPPAASGGQNVLAAVAPAGPTSSITGTIASNARLQVTKSTNDPSYVAVPAGVVFNVLNSGGTTVDTVTTVAGGVAGPSSANLPAGNYTIVEVSVPAGSGLVLGTTPVPFTVTPAEVGTPVAFTVNVADLDAVTPGSILITKSDSDTKLGLGGAQFTVAYDSANNGVFSTPITGPNPDGSFTTAASGIAVDPSGALATLLPGTYQVTETLAPPGHILPTPVAQNITIPIGGGPEYVNFADQTRPTITTSATAAGQVGKPISDAATLVASIHATGTILFDAYGPFSSSSAATCTATTLAFTSSPVTVSGSGTYPMSGGFSPTTPGLYEWIENYSGDTNNTAVSGTCGASGETSSVVGVTTTATVQASNNQPISDTVAITGPLPVGSLITSTLYRATDTSCASPLWTTPEATSTTATTYVLDGITEPAGNYQWVETVTSPGAVTIAIGSCNAALEASAVLSSIPAATKSPLSAIPAAVTG